MILNQEQRATKAGENVISLAKAKVPHKLICQSDDDTEERSRDHQRYND